MEKEENINVLDIPDNEVPSVINEKFNQLADIRNEVNKLQLNSEEVKNNAAIIKDKKVGVFAKKNAIQDLQKLTANIAENQATNIEITNKILVYQQQTAEVMKFLLGLGVTNLATNRAVVKQLKDRLSSAQDTPIDEYEEKEILSVLRQLKAQEDILEKQERLSKRLNDIDNKNTELEKNNAALALQLEHHQRKIKKIQYVSILLISFFSIFAIVSFILGLLAILK